MILPCSSGAGPLCQTISRSRAVVLKRVSQPLVLLCLVQQGLVLGHGTYQVLAGRVSILTAFRVLYLRSFRAARTVAADTSVKCLSGSDMRSLMYSLNAAILLYDFTFPPVSSAHSSSKLVVYRLIVFSITLAAKSTACASIVYLSVKLPYHLFGIGQLREVGGNIVFASNVLKECSSFSTSSKLFDAKLKLIVVMLRILGLITLDMARK